MKACNSDKISQVLYDQMSSIADKINLERTKRVNEMIEGAIPKWKVSLIRRIPFLSKILRYCIVVQPLEKLEGDIVREELHLLRGSKKISSAKFTVRDKRFLDDGRTA